MLIRITYDNELAYQKVTKKRRLYKITDIGESNNYVVQTRGEPTVFSDWKPQKDTCDENVGDNCRDYNYWVYVRFVKQRNDYDPCLDKFVISHRRQCYCAQVDQISRHLFPVLIDIKHKYVVAHNWDF